MMNLLVLENIVHYTVLFPRKYSICVFLEYTVQNLSVLNTVIIWSVNSKYAIYTVCSICTFFLCIITVAAITDV